MSDNIQSDCTKDDGNNLPFGGAQRELLATAEVIEPSLGMETPSGDGGINLLPFNISTIN